MNVLEQAEKYAEGKANQAITKAIAEAYIEGYQAGYKDREEEIPMELRDNKNQYVDLGLPSGTLWSNDYEKDRNGERLYMPYKDASQMKLPTIEQVQELLYRCAWELDSVYSPQYAQCIGPNGKRIRFDITGYADAIYTKDQHDIYFWTYDNNKSDNRDAAYIYSGYQKTCRAASIYKEITKKFQGCHLPVRTVK